MAELGKLTAIFDADTRKFDVGLRGVQSKMAAVTNQLHQVTGSSNFATTALTGLSTKLGLVAGGSVIAASAISAVAVGLFSLVKASAAVGGELFDLSQKTNFTVETLSGLSIVAKTTGSDIKGLSASLGIFQKNMEAAGDTTSKQGELFKRLNIDTRDNEKALRQAFTQLDKLGDGAHQTAIAMQLFGRSGKDVLAIVKETNGDLDKAIAKYEKMGLIISHGAAAASDRFNDVLEETTLQLSAVTRSIGLELLPVATEALQSISFWLAENKGAWSSWGTTISDVIRGVRTVAESEIGTIIGFIARLGAEISGLPSIARGLSSIGAGSRPQEDFFGPGGAARGGRRSLPGTPEYLAMQRRLEALGLSNTRTSVGGRGGRGGGGSPRQDPGVQLLKQLEEQYQNLTPRTELLKVQEKLLGVEYVKTTDAVKKKLQIVAMEIDQQTMILGITRERTVAMKTEREEFEKMVDLVREAGDQGIPFFSRRRTMNDLTGLLGTEGTRRRSIADGATRERIATVEETVLRERLGMIREQMENLASDISGTFSRALYDGISGGAKRGLQSLALGFLDMIQQVILGKLKNALADALTGSATSGVLGKILGFGLSAVAGGVGGSIGAGGGSSFAGAAARASGGPVLAGLPYKVHRDEVIMPMQNGMVFNKGQQQGVTNIYNIQLPPAAKGSYQSPASQRELGNKLLGMIQSTQT